MNPAIYYLSSLEIDVPYVPTGVLMPDGKVWDQYNLNTSRYSDGTPIPRISVNATWAALTTGGCRFYDNDSTNAALFGRLYNWYAVNGIDGSGITKDIAPEGWRVATEDDWKTLASFYGTNGTNSNPTAGGYLKEPGTTYWQPTNSILTPTSGFNARGGGQANSGSGFLYIYIYGVWWPFGSDSTRVLTMENNTTILTFSGIGVPNRGYSVRLIKKDTTVQGFTVSISDLNALSITGTGTFGDVPATPDFIEKGICWSTSANPNRFLDPYEAALDTNKTTYSITVDPLVASTIYYVRAYIKLDATDVRYSTNIIQFTTLSGAPVSINTTAISNVGSTTATSGGTITDNASYPTLQKGVCWNTTGLPTISNSRTTDGPGGGTFVSSITGLSIATTYYVRSYCTNAAGTFYGNALAPFTTLASPNSKPIFGLYSAYHAYSLRLIGQGYTGACIKVRRNVSGVNVYADVLFNGSTLNSTISLASSIIITSGTSSATTLGQLAAIPGYGTADPGIPANQSIVINTWFDQSGNNKHLVQVNLIPSPFIITNGVLEQKDGNVAVNCPGAHTVALLDTSVSYNNVSCYVVINTISATTGTSAYGLSGNSTQRFLVPRDTTIAYNTLATFPITGIVANVDRLYEITCGASTTSAYSNGVQSSVTSVASLNITSSVIRVGGNGNVTYMNGHVKEVIAMIGDSGTTRTDIENNINSYYSIW